MKKEARQEIQKFLVVGGLSTVINYGLFYVLFQFASTNHLVAATTGYIAGLIFGYFFNRSWTFKSENEKKKQEFSQYVGVYLLSLVLSMLFLEMLVRFGLDARLANIGAIGLSTVTNFIGCKFLVFKKSCQQVSSEPQKN